MEKNKKTKNLTYIDMKEETGLSLGTISRYYNNGSISKKSKKIIEDYIKKYNFTPNVGAQIIRGYEKCIYMVIPKLLDNLTFNKIANKCIELLKSKGISTYIVEGTTDVNVFMDTVRETLLRRPKNIFLFPPTMTKELEEFINSIDANTIVYGYDSTNKKSINFDSYSSMKKMVTRIIDENDGKFKKIIYFGLDDYNQCFGKNRYQGFIDAIGGRGIKHESFKIKDNSLDEIRKIWENFNKKIDDDTFLICGTHKIFAASFLAKQILKKNFMISDVCVKNVFDDFKSYDYKIFIDDEKIASAFYSLLYSNKNSSILIECELIKVYQE